MNNKNSLQADMWRIETNDQYNRIVRVVGFLSIGVFILSILFLRDFLGIPYEQTLASLLNSVMYTAWGCLACSFLLGLIYSWLSVKWIKLAWGQKIELSEHCLEQLMDVSFVVMGMLFLAGTALSVYFFTTLGIAS